MTEDIDTDSSKEQENNNMDWKKKGFDKHERLTLRINLEEAIRRQSNNKIQNETHKKLRAKPIKNKSFRKNKIRTSIYDDEDEDEDEEEYILLPVFNNLPKFSLEKALTPKEKLQLNQMEKGSKQPKSEQIQIEQINFQNIPTKETQIEIKNDIKNRFPKTNEKKQNDDFLEWDTLKDINTDKKIPVEDIKKQQNKEKDIAPTIKDIELLLSQEKEENIQNQKKSQEDTRAIILEKSGRTNIQQKPKKNKKEAHHEENFAPKNHIQENER